MASKTVGASDTTTGSLGIGACTCVGSKGAGAGTGAGAGAGTGSSAKTTRYPGLSSTGAGATCGAEGFLVGFVVDAALMGLVSASAMETVECGAEDGFGAAAGLRVPEAALLGL